MGSAVTYLDMYRAGFWESWRGRRVISDCP